MFIVHKILFVIKNVSIQVKPTQMNTKPKEHERKHNQNLLEVIVLLMELINSINNLEKMNTSSTIKPN